MAFTITHSPTTQAHLIAANASAKVSASRAQSIVALRKFLKEIEPTAQPDTLLAGDTRFGTVDTMLLEKSKPDKNGIYSNIKLIKQSFDSMKDLIKAVQANPSMFDSRLFPITTIAYRPINDNYHYILIRKLNLNKDNIEKYLLLI
jgi:hypothetical protein